MTITREVIANGVRHYVRVNGSHVEWFDADELDRKIANAWRALTATTS